jgi:hypothetical protein
VPADFIADGPSLFEGDAARESTRRYTTWLQQNRFAESGERRRDARRLAGTGWRDDDGAALGSNEPDDRIDMLINR